MDIFVRNVPPSCTENQLKKVFRPHLEQLGVSSYHCEKLKAKNCAMLTIADRAAAERLLTLSSYPVPRMPQTLPARPIQIRGNILNITQSTTMPVQLLLDCLRQEEAQARTRGHSLSTQDDPSVGTPSTFAISTLQNGYWSYREDQLIFVPNYSENRRGSLVLGRRNMIVVLPRTNIHMHNIHIRIPYSLIDSIVVGDTSEGCITFSLMQTPVFHRLIDASEMELEMQVGRLQIAQHYPNGINARLRICDLGTDHSPTVGTSFAYRLLLGNHSELQLLCKRLKMIRGSPGTIRIITPITTYLRETATEMLKLKNMLADVEKGYGGMPWIVKFQLQRLAQNGYLPPLYVARLLPAIQKLLKTLPDVKVVEGIRAWTKRNSWPGPNTPPEEQNLNKVIKMISDAANSFKLVGSAYHLVRSHAQLGMVHKVFVTPSSIYLQGPDLETKNRVLRKYPDNMIDFVRVTFVDEDFQSLRTDFGASMEAVYHRIKSVLDGFIDIAGYHYRFLGFSHSSLRSQQCWYMHPFLLDGRLMLPKHIIEGLGDFKNFRSPAKCAARIGQAFSDATDSIYIGPDCVVAENVPDVERFGRCFTDGVGTVSEDLLHDIWEQFSATKKERATVLQIRYQGAKGVLSLDSRLQGKQMMLRKSMIKFQGSKDQSLEITGAAFRPLAMFLNRQFIQIFESLGVEPQAFLDLQQKAVDRLHRLMDSPATVSEYLSKNMIGMDSQAGFLVGKLDEIGLNFRDDQFLSHMVDVAAMVQLRDIKHRARIPIEKAHTLYGVADETGFLKEGQVYVAVRNAENVRTVINGFVIVTRSPALHPGDIQFANARSVPADSPLNKLHNCIVFSTQGSRDLPSQLSGGDLDGDIYNVIFEPSLWPKRIYQPASYRMVKPIDIQRPVETTDITKFFLEFMATDQLGRISTVHQQVADQREKGTRDPDCMLLAEMASVAVDFSKTGVAVDISQIHTIKFERRLRPDFMAPSPRLVLSDAELRALHLEEADNLQEDNLDEANSHLEPDLRPMRFYESNKALGQLYRAIDETRFLRATQTWYQVTSASARDGEPLMQRLWQYVTRECALFTWTHHAELAQEIQESYEASVLDAMHTYSPHPRVPLQELEVVTGSIMGREGGGLSRRTREAAINMKDRHARDVRYAVDWIVYGDGDGEATECYADSGFEGPRSAAHHGEALCRALACLDLAMRTDGERRNRHGNFLYSFKYLAAAVVLREMGFVFGQQLRPV